MHTNSSPLILALDFSTQKSALDFVNQLDPSLCALKIGKNMFTRFGPDFVRLLIEKKFRVFLDLKFHDILNTVSDACTAAAELGVWMVNIHIAGGEKMMRAARSAIDAFPKEQRPLLIGVTVLTSLDEHDLKFLGISDSIENTVLRFAKAAQSCGLDGVVCSAQEAKLLKETCGQDFLLVTPGIRLETDVIDDQKRTVTPHEALQAGADYLVIGRAITQAKDPIAVLHYLKNTVLSKK